MKAIQFSQRKLDRLLDQINEKTGDEPLTNDEEEALAQYNYGDWFDIEGED